MHRARWLRGSILGLSFGLAAAASASACDRGSATSAGDAGTDTSPPPKKRLLVVTHTTGFRHTSIEVAEQTLADLAPSELEVSFARNADDVKARLTPAGLADVDAVFFANTSGNLGIPDLNAFLDWIAAGHSFLGAHAASDTYHDEPAYLAMLGGEFLTHGGQCEVDVNVEDPTNLAVAHLAPSFLVFDEIYEHKTDPRPLVHVLLSLDRHPPDGHPEAGMPGDFPLSWTKSHGRGRVFYTALGHREDVWQSEHFRQHLLGAIREGLAPR